MQVTDCFVQLFYFIIFIILSSRNVIGKKCTLSNRETGTCLPIDDCKAFRKLMASENTNSQISSYFSQDQCRQKSNLTICCPSEGSVGFCGRQLKIKLDDRIVGGDETYPGEFPWHALLVYRKPFYLIGHHCGGSLITNMHVVTAAHCTSRGILPDTWEVSKVRLGENDLSTLEDCRLSREEPPKCGIEIDISKIIIHGRYTAQQGSPHDIAVLKLKQTVQYTEYILPVCLPLSGKVRSDIGTGIIIGFGKTEKSPASEKLIKAEIDIQDHRKCVSQYSEQGRQIQNTQICASSPKSDSCSGDSGGGFIVQDNGTSYLIGIISFGTRKCDSKYPGIYTKVQNYLEWIKNKIKE